MTATGSPRRRRMGKAPELSLSRKRAILADIITSNKSAFKPGLNPDMEAAERDLLVGYIGSLERWEADLGRADPPPAVDELDWRANVLNEEIRSWQGILMTEPTLSSKERSDMMKTIGELERWKAELKGRRK